MRGLQTETESESSRAGVSVFAPFSDIDVRQRSLAKTGSGQRSRGGKLTQKEGDHFCHDNVLRAKDVVAIEEVKREQKETEQAEAVHAHIEKKRRARMMERCEKRIYIYVSFALPFCTKNDHFTKTGSGQNRESAQKEILFAFFAYQDELDAIDLEPRGGGARGTARCRGEVCSRNERPLFCDV